MVKTKEAQRAMVERHVESGKVSLARQRRVIETLHALGRDTTLAERSLELLEMTQRKHVEHLDRLKAQP